MSASPWRLVDKPAGLSTHAAHPGDLGVAEWLDLHLGERVHVCSRLDKGTSGVLPLARTAEASAEAERVHAAGTARKTYLLLTDKRPALASWRRNDPLDGEPAETAFATVRSGAGVHLLKAEIRRGRRHQIRRHAAASGIPILGDSEYGGTPFPRLGLHCAEVIWPGEPAPWAAQLPGTFERALAGSDPLLTGLEAALERRGVFLDPATNALRLAHRGELSGEPVSIDRFGDHLLVTGYEESVSPRDWLERLGACLDLLQARLGCRGGWVRSHRRGPHGRSLVERALPFGETPPPVHWVRESGLGFEIRLDDALHPGLFPDQRDNRRRLARWSAGKRVANLFAFTASFSAAAVAAGAEVVFSVDLAAGSLERGKRTFARNGLDREGRGKFIVEDVRDWLARQVRKKARDGAAWRPWDLIVCDPPVFAGGDRSFSVEKEWAAMARAIRDILADDGRVLFSNNHQSGDGGRYQEELSEVFAEVIRMNPPLDFPALPGQPEWVRHYWCRP